MTVLANIYSFQKIWISDWIESKIYLKRNGSYISLAQLRCLSPLKHFTAVCNMQRPVERKLDPGNNNCIYFYEMLNTTVTCHIKETLTCPIPAQTTPNFLAWPWKHCKWSVFSYSLHHREQQGNFTLLFKVFASISSSIAGEEQFTSSCVLKLHWSIRMYFHF